MKNSEMSWFFITAIVTYKCHETPCKQEQFQLIIITPFECWLSAYSAWPDPLRALIFNFCAWGLLPTPPLMVSVRKWVSSGLTLSNKTTNIYKYNILPLEGGGVTILTVSDMYCKKWNILCSYTGYIKFNHQPCMLKNMHRTGVSIWVCHGFHVLSPE